VENYSVCAEIFPNKIDMAFNVRIYSAVDYDNGSIPIEEGGRY